LKSSFGTYLSAAFNARPLGIFVPPNWLGLAAFAMLGLVNPGFWIVGAGLELGYLFTLVSSRRFRNLVDARQTATAGQDAWQKAEQLLKRLPPDLVKRYRAVAAQCQQTLADPGALGPLLAENLNRMLWVYLRLLRTLESLTTLIHPGAGDSTDDLEDQLKSLTQKMEASENEELRRSLSGQAEILAARVKARREAADKRDVVMAELDRLEQQVNYLREQVALAQTPEVVTEQIDAISDSLNTTNDWIVDQQRILGLSTDEEDAGGKPLVQYTKG
jgi:hypothetical protein